MKNITITIGQPDYKLLRTQKLVLLKTIDTVPKKEQKALLGILNFIDHIQDQIVEAGVTEKTVFGRPF